MELSGLLFYGISLLTLAGIYGILSLGLNLQWGFTGQFNIGIAGFFAIGAYSTAILTAAPSNSFIGGFGLPTPVGLVVAVIMSGLLSVLIGWVTMRLRTDYLAIATIGIAEIIRLLLKNEDWLTNGVRGIPAVPKPLGLDSPLAFLIGVIVVLAVVYVLMEAARKSPWGRVLRAIRENENGVMAAGKNIQRFRLEAFVVGSTVMGLAGGLYAHYFGFISPEAFEPLFATFLVWVMLIAGGSGNNKGAILGAVLIWFVWSGSELATGYLPAERQAQAGAVRVLLVAVLLQVILLTRPQGLLPEDMGTGRTSDPTPKEGRPRKVPAGE
ncbi:branched-chain amino acid ABC transporter permease [Caenispirillum salinarum]|uniref:branched-chain amino acid ABC transporter permease n=1 Tax=Caenispirillum salinarum TaxID=859058 RepID=UPI00384ED9CB